MFPVMWKRRGLKVKGINQCTYMYRYREGGREGGREGRRERGRVRERTMLMKAPIMTQAMARIAMMSREKYELMRNRESRMTGLDLTLPSRIWGSMENILIIFTILKNVWVIHWGLNPRPPTLAVDALTTEPHSHSMKQPQLAHVTIFAKTDHSALMFDIEILVLCCSVCVLLYRMVRSESR